MSEKEKSVITVATTVAAPVEKVWECWTKPEHIVHWNNASPEWHTPKADNDLREGGRFDFRMEARDGSAGFDFGAEYTKVMELKELSYRMDDGRLATVKFTPAEGATRVDESFDAESTNSEELQRTGWQAILDNFKRYVEAKAND